MTGFSIEVPKEIFRVTAVDSHQPQPHGIASEVT
jgi:hypothetical protein